MRYAAYYKTQLSNEEQAAYNALCSGIQKCQSSVTTPLFDKSRIDTLIFSITYDNPEFFHVDFNRTIIQTFPDSYKFMLHYYMEQTEYENLINQLSRKTDQLIRQIRTQSKLQQAHAVHDWMVRNITYSSNKHFTNSCYTAPGAILYRECVCAGFAMAYKYFMDQLRVHCMVVCGEGIHPSDGSRGPHAWNMILLNHKPYHVDVTFDHLFAGKYCSKAHFLLSTKNILNNHTIDNTLPVPDCPEDGGMLKLVSSTKELMHFLDTESKQNVPYSEVRLSVGFTSERLFNEIQKWMERHLNVQLSRRPQYWYGDYHRTLFIIWL